MVIISIMVLCNAIVVIEYDRRRSAWLPSAPLDIEFGNNKTGHSNIPLKLTYGGQRAGNIWLISHKARS